MGKWEGRDGRQGRPARAHRAESCTETANRKERIASLVGPGMIGDSRIASQQ